MFYWYHLAELLKSEVVKSHNCTKFSRICAKFRYLSAKLVKTGNIFMFLTQSDKVKKKHPVLKAFMQISLRKIIIKEF